MGKRRGKVQKGTSRDKLLQEAGYEEPKKAPEYLRILAQQAQTSTPAMNAFLKVTKTVDEKKVAVMAVPGEQCPTCRQYVFEGFQMTGDQIGSVIESIDYIRRNGE